MDSDSAQWPWLAAWFALALPLCYIYLYNEYPHSKQKKSSFHLLLWALSFLFAFISLLAAAFAATMLGILIVPWIIGISEISGGNIEKSDLTHFGEFLRFAIPVAVAGLWLGAHIAKSSAAAKRVDPKT